MKIIAQNKKAFHDYDILERVEAGLVLTGNEVKALRLGKVSLVGAFATVMAGELYLNNCNINPYEKAFLQEEQDATRRRKLLLHRREMNKLIADIAIKGTTIVPLKLYFNKKNFVKVELGIAKHKKAAGKKQALKERDIKREMDRDVRGKW